MMRILIAAAVAAFAIQAAAARSSTGLNDVRGRPP
jgi:hypothetical protein